MELVLQLILWVWLTPTCLISVTTCLVGVVYFKMAAARVTLYSSVENCRQRRNGRVSFLAEYFDLYLLFDLFIFDFL